MACLTSTQIYYVQYNKFHLDFLHLLHQVVAVANVIKAIVPGSSRSSCVLKTVVSSNSQHVYFKAAKTGKPNKGKKKKEEIKWRENKQTHTQSILQGFI